MDKINVNRLLQMKKNGEKITMLTGYDYMMTKLLNEAGVEIILVGDSVGTVKLGFENTLPVTMEDMIYHCKTVRRANTNAFLIADMPFMSYEARVEDAVENAGKLIKSAGAEAVKIEGGVQFIDKIKAIIGAKIPVMGHIGLTPQSIHQMGYKVQGKTPAQAEQLMKDAKALEEAGVFAMVMEGVPSELAGEITSQLSVPTIGIGAGPKCDGQVLVTDDLLGFFTDFKPKFVKRYANLRPVMIDAVKQYCREVKEGKFPDEEHSYK